MEINWGKVSEIVLEAVLSGLISAGVVIGAYLLGRRQGDINLKGQAKINRLETLTEERAALVETRNERLVTLRHSGNLSSEQEKDENRVWDELLYIRLPRAVLDFPQIKKFDADIAKLDTEIEALEKELR